MAYVIAFVLVILRYPVATRSRLSPISNLLLCYFIVYTTIT